MRFKIFIVILLFAESLSIGNAQDKSRLDDLDSFLKKKDSLANNLMKAYFFEKTDPDSCEIYLKSSLSLAQRMNDYLSQSKILLKLISLYKEKGESKKISDNEDVLISVNKMLLSQSEGKEKLKFLSDIADSFADANTDSAIYYYKKVISISEKFGETESEANAHLNTGYIYSHIEDNSRALDEFQKSLNLFEKKGNKRGMGESYQAISKLFLFFGDLQNALSLEKEAAKNYTEVKDNSGYFSAMRHIGEIYLSLGDSVKSLEILITAVDSALKNNEYDNASSLYQSIGYYYSATKNYGKAIEYLKKGLFLRISNKEPVIKIINNYNSLADAYREMGDYRTSLRYYLMSLKLLNNLGNLNILSRTQKNLGITYSVLGDYINSLSYLQKSIITAELIGNRYDVLGCYPEIIRVYEKTKNYKKALQYFGQYTILKDSIDGSVNQNKISQFRNIYEREKRAKEIEKLKTEDQKFILISAFAITVLLLVVLLVLLSRYKFKISSNKILIDQNKKIDDMLAEVNELNSTLKISEATYRNLFERNPMPMLIWEENTRNILAVNNALINHYGYSKEEFLSMTINDMRGAEFMYQLENRFNIYPFDLSRIPNIKHMKKNGDLIDVEIMSHSFLFEGRRANNVMIQDVTDRKRVEQAVMDSEERYRNLFEGAPDSIILIDYKLNIVKDANPAAIKLFRRSWTDLIGTDYLDFFPPQHFNEVKEFFSKISYNFNPEVLETEIKLGNSSTAAIEISGILVSISNFMVYQIYIRDITLRKQTEKALRESEKKLIKIQNIVQLGNWELDLELKNFWISDEARLIIGIGKSGNDVSFDEMLNMVVPEDRNKFQLAVRELISKGSDFDISFGITSQINNELRILHSKAELIKNDNGESLKILGAVRDITLMKQYQDELLRAKEEAELSDRRKSDFLAQMSHEIRSPVNIILSFASLVRDKLSSRTDNDIKMCFNAIDNGGRRLIRTIDLVLNVADIQTGKYDINREKINLAREIIENLMLEFTSAAGSKNIKLEFVNKIGERELFVDRYTITQIFANLIDNAIKYTAKGSVTIELSGNNERVNISVTDTGKGISKEYLPRLFDPFTQEEHGYTKRLEGSGLGLSLVKKYCELNGAEINVESEKGMGTKFTVVFEAQDACLN